MAASCDGAQCAYSFSLQPYVLHLRTEFGTSHSSSSSRTNALLSVSRGSWTGYGEVGLPPKKPGCYKAAYADVEEGVAQVVALFKQSSGTTVKTWQAVIDDWFTESELEARWVVLCLFELALLDLHRQIEGKDSLMDLLTLPVDCKQEKANGSTFSFYTVALNKDLDEMAASTIFGLAHTPYLKVKLNNDVAFCGKALSLVADRVRARGGKLSVDANAAWSPSVAMEFLEILAAHQDIVYMVEQPFPITLSDLELREWAAIKDAYNTRGLTIYGDESISTAEDVVRLQTVMNGVNVKLEKAGGIRGGLAVVAAAARCKLAVWVGIMVSSSLACNAAFELLALATDGFGDLDGALLVTEESDLFEGGFNWDNTTGQLTRRKGSMHVRPKQARI